MSKDLWGKPPDQKTAMAQSELPTTEELTNQTLELIKTQTDADHNSDYSPKKKRYHNPLKHAVDGKHYNWTDADSGYLPANTVNVILSAPSVSHGIAEVALRAKELFEMDSDLPVTDDELTGIVVEIAERFGRAAASELLAAKLLEEKGANLNKPRRGDEDKKIDIRTDEALHQVKLNDEPRSDWVPQELPQNNSPEDDDREKNLIWVKPDGTVMDLKPKEERGHKLTDRYEEL